VPRDVLLAVVFALVAAAFRLPGLGFPPNEYFDEVYHAVSARQYLGGQAPVEWVHPPMAKLLISLGVAAFGYHSWAWRLAPALAGILLAPIFFLLARQVLETRRAAVLATVLLLCDGVYLVQSRIAMTNIFAVLFQTSAVLCVVRGARQERLSLRALLASGLFFSLALATRWTTLFAAGLLFLVLLALRGRRLLRVRELAACAAAFVLLPVVLYVVSYLPLGTLRPGLVPWHSLGDLWALQKEVFAYHSHLNASHPYFSTWWTWPFLYRPTWYFFKNEFGMIRGIVAIGNPALWWVSVPVTLWALVTGLVQREPRRLFGAIGFCCLYLPWGISPRTLNYGHYLFEAIPYVCLVLGLLLDRHWDDRFGLAARAYLLLVALLFLFFTPLLMGLPLPTSWFYFRVGRAIGPWSWFRSWI
jgi:dolichyl-phosphate-mannose-protein mannosyltransferase